LEVDLCDGAIVEWEAFSIERGETVSFALPSSSAAVLNRVTGANPSHIWGSLSSNGQVILVNPLGIFFGNESRIEAGAFIASTFDIHNDLFAQRKELFWTFSEKAERIEHRGFIRANRIEFQAPEIYLFEGSRCQASLTGSGGEIRIGGKENTRFLWVQEGALISAEAIESGSGGSVVLSSKGVAHFEGLILARGSPSGGNGGFAEVSGGYLSYIGFADLRADNGNAGTLLLDPTNISITAGIDANNTPTAGFVFPLICGGNSPASTQNATSSGFPSSMISVAPTLTAQIAAGNIIIDSTGGAGGSGNITWNPLADFLYGSGNDLILRAPSTGTVTILSNVQNSGAGDVIIDSEGPAVLINIATNSQAVAFGSLDGLTQICAPSAVVTLQAGNMTTTDYAQVGFHAGTGSTANGAISITCASLNLFGSALDRCFAQIGHGQMEMAGGQTLDTAPTAAITVVSSGNITLAGSSIAPGGGTNAAAIIGHGQRNLFPPSLIEGDISVVSGGNISLLSNPRGGASSVTARIGHGVNGTLPGTDFTADAEVFVEAAGNISMAYTAGGTFHDLSIGHFAATGDLLGDVTAISGGSISINGNPGGGAGFRTAIGHMTFSGSVTGNTRVFSCQDIILNTRNSDVFAIGTPVASVGNIVVGDVEVAAGRDILLTANGTSAAGRIGNNFSAAGSATRTFVASGRDIVIAGTRNIGIAGFGDIFVAAGRNIIVTSNSAVATVFVGTDNTTNLATPRTTRVFAGGDVIASNPVAGGRAVIGRGSSPTASYTCFLDVRAGGDIQLSSPFTTNGANVLIPTSGSIFIEADTEVPAGAQWTAGGGQITSVCQTVPNIPILLSSSCPSTGFSSDSFAISADALGGIRFDAGGNGGSVGLQTTLGNITLHSAPNQANGAAQNLVIGTGANNVNILTVSGNIEIWGSQTSSSCVRGDSFHNITLDQALITSGSVFISSNNDFMMTPVSSIDTSGGNGPVALIVDNQAPFSPLIGRGRFQMNSGSSIATGTGLLQIYTALQSANSINGLLNTLPFSRGQLFVDSNQEVWCTYFCSPLAGSPFTVSYKDCLQQLTAQAMIVVDQFLIDLHPYNEFPGWKAPFRFGYAASMVLRPSNIPYYLRRRHLNHLNHPKTYTVYQ
jgi:filamentous hemagglutinin family protein